MKMSSQGGALDRFSPIFATNGNNPAAHVPPVRGFSLAFLVGLQDLAALLFPSQVFARAIAS